MQKYLVIVQIGGPGDKEIWLPGSSIELDDMRAALHLRAGNIRPLEQTILPELPASDVVIHEPEVATWQQ